MAEEFKNKILFVDLDSLITGKHNEIFKDLGHVTDEGRTMKSEWIGKAILGNVNSSGILSQRNENLDNAGVFALNGAAWGAFDGDFKVAGMGAGVSAGTYLAWSWLTGKKPSISLPQGTEIWIDMEDLETAPEVNL